MKIEKRALSELHSPEHNVRIHSAKQIEEFKHSIKMFGQIRPVVVDETGTILAGNGLCIAMQELGYTDADCYVVSGMTDVQKKKLMLADNRIFSLGVDDVESFDTIIRELGDVDIPGYDDSLLQTLLDSAESIDDTLSGYGIISEETKSSMQEASRRYEQKNEDFLQSSQELKPNQPSTGTEPTYDVGPKASEPTAEPISTQKTSEANIPSGIEAPMEERMVKLERRYIICPKCGEKIWL